MKSQDGLDLVCGGLVLLAVFVAASAQAAPRGAIAEERLEPSQLVLQPLFEFERAALTVEGPAGYFVEQAFWPGEAVRLALSDGEGDALPDGRYRYSLRMSPGSANSSDVQEGLFFIDEGSGVSRTERRDQLASIRDALNQEREKRLQELQRAAPISRDEEGATVIPDPSYALSIDGDFALGGYVFKEGKPFLHNYGGSYYGNTALGLDALVSVTPQFDPYPFPTYQGSFNTAAGMKALLSNTTGGYNTASGYKALHSNTTGFSNTASGYGALRSNTTGWANTASGHVALAFNTTGSYNTASGYRALLFNTTGSRNTASGAYALYNNTTGRQNTAVGSHALNYSGDGSSNTAIGNYALSHNTAGSDNTAVGVSALSGTPGSANTAVGVYALWGTAGDRNVAIGHWAGDSAMTGNDNIFISNEGAFTDNAVIKIGTQGTQNKTFIAGIRGTTTDVANAIPVLIDSSGQLGTVSSSRRFKEEIRDIGETSGRLLDLRPVTFRYRQHEGSDESRLQYGLIAEEVAEVFPELVVSSEDGQPETVLYHLMTAMLLNELQKQARLNQEQQLEVERLRSVERELVAIKARLADLEAVEEPTLRVAAGRHPPPESASP